MPTQQVKRQSIKRNKIILWLAATAVLLAVFFFLVPLLQAFVLRASLESESMQTLSNSRRQIQSALNQQIDVMAQSLGATPEATYDVTYNSCYTDTSDSGWFANNYNFNCLLTKFAFIEVADDSPLNESINLYAKPAAKEFSITNTDYYGDLYYFNTDFKNTGTTAYDFPYRVYVVKDNTYTNIQDVLAVDAVASSPRVVAYASNEEVANRSTLEEHGRKELRTKSTYVVLQSGEDYFRKDIGCRIPSIIFCDSPI